MTPAERKAAAEVMASDGPWDLRLRGSNTWDQSLDPAFDWSEFEYRVRPKLTVRYLNIYSVNNVIRSLHPSRREADCNAECNRIACVRIEFLPGQFDE